MEDVSQTIGGLIPNTWFAQRMKLAPINASVGALGTAGGDCIEGYRRYKLQFRCDWKNKAYY